MFDFPSKLLKTIICKLRSITESSPKRHTLKVEIFARISFHESRNVKYMRELNFANFAKNLISIFLLSKIVGIVRLCIFFIKRNDRYDYRQGGEMFSIHVSKSSEKKNLITLKKSKRYIKKKFNFEVFKNRIFCWSIISRIK